MSPVVTVAQVSAVSVEISAAWGEWANGNVAKTERLARMVPPSDEAHHLLFLVAVVKGDYGVALERYGQIDRSYARLTELDMPVVDALLHTGRAADAYRFAMERKMNGTLISALELRAARPLRVTLDNSTIIPFADHPLTSYFPVFHAELESEPLTVHLDTGGTFLHMGPERAQALGIELTEGGKGFHGTRSVPLQIGIAARFQIGDAVLENVPVTTLASLEGQQDFVIFGTSVLQQFLSTIDYPNQRLVLSPRDSVYAPGHLSMIEGVESVEIPFYLWGDHYMFGRGGFGSRSD